VSNLQIHWAPEYAFFVPPEFRDPEFFDSMQWDIVEGGGHRVTSPLRPGRTYYFSPSAVLLVIHQPVIEGLEQVPLTLPVEPEPEPPRKRFRR
jgi:hypothetical protein